MDNSIKISDGNKQLDRKRKSILSTLADLRNEGVVTEKEFEYFHEKINEGGELNLILNDVLSKEKEIKKQLKETKAYRNKLKISMQKKKIKAMQERNLDETRGALELLLEEKGNKINYEQKKLLDK